ncbi:MAG: PKD domain-containing protein, partial [Candidatus Omnitrophica bacterium]|nr:PKD domain-containing protein [Candidatus Omnitrophota bacterium]
MSGYNPLLVNFSGYATDSFSTIATYSWDFGDGTPKGSGASTKHTYLRPGTYNVVLTVTDKLGASAASTIVIQCKPSRLLL